MLQSVWLSCSVDRRSGAFVRSSKSMNGFVVFGVAVVLGAPVVMVDDDGWVGGSISAGW